MIVPNEMQNILRAEVLSTMSGHVRCCFEDYSKPKMPCISLAISFPDLWGKAGRKGKKIEDGGGGGGMEVF